MVTLWFSWTEPKSYHNYKQTKLCGLIWVLNSKEWNSIFFTKSSRCDGGKLWSWIYTKVTWSRIKICIICLAYIVGEFVNIYLCIYFCKYCILLKNQLSLKICWFRCFLSKMLLLALNLIFLQNFVYICSTTLEILSSVFFF